MGQNVPLFHKGVNFFDCVKGRTIEWQRKHERFTQPTDGRNVTGEYDPSIHGFNGMTRTSLPNQIQLFQENIFAAADELGGVFDFNLDLNRGRMLGTGE
jgi:choline dehydrogenase